MAKKYKMLYKREECIGFGGCAAASPFFEMNDDTKADMVKGSKLNKDGWWEVIIDEKDFPKNKDAAEICPVKVIKIFDLETGEQIV